MSIQFHIQLLREPIKIPDHLLQLFGSAATGDPGWVDFDHGSSLPFSRVLVME
jgi:hypothetical protein